jgi:hypothetical protein
MQIIDTDFNPNREREVEGEHPPIKGRILTAPKFAKHTTPQYIFLDVSCTERFPSVLKNVENRKANLCTPISKVWFPFPLFSRAVSQNLLNRISHKTVNKYGGCLEIQLPLYATCAYNWVNFHETHACATTFCNKRM